MLLNNIFAIQTVRELSKSESSRFQQNIQCQSVKKINTSQCKACLFVDDFSNQEFEKNDTFDVQPMTLERV